MPKLPTPTPSPKHGKAKVSLPVAAAHKTGVPMAGAAKLQPPTAKARPVRTSKLQGTATQLEGTPRKKRGGISRRALIGGMAATGVIAAVATTLATCHKTENDPDGTPEVLDDSSATNITKEFEQKDFGLTAAATWELPLGTVVHAGPGAWKPALAQGDTAAHMLKACALSSATGKMVDVVTQTTTDKSGWLIFDARCSDTVFAWVELDPRTRAWALFAAGFANGALSGTPTKLWESNSDYDPPSLACYESSVMWLVMPSTSGNKRSESSFCYVWQLGTKEAEAKIESPGRFATPISISGDTVVLTPRVNASQGTYYGITAYDARDALASQLDRVVLPQSIRPMYATRVGDNFVFSIEANYNSGGLFSHMGTYIGPAGGPYHFLSREPAAQACGNAEGVYAIKSGASYFVVNVADKSFDILTATNRSLGYGEYPASEGQVDSLLTFSTVKDQDTGYPTTVVARSVALPTEQVSS